ncbi:hypothetical protein DKX38_030105 (mitochondrion) [Salix brachista]|uniref:Uncharacterized protein n=1 Tax=Salix brachista TaxID=2182728 RepID=A0A5N5IZ63_9ROSI|nr:hypothetical protein DKX38_030105 [Salix brachista]
MEGFSIPKRDEYRLYGKDPQPMWMRHWLDDGRLAAMISWELTYVSSLSCGLVLSPDMCEINQSLTSTSWTTPLYRMWGINRLLTGATPPPLPIDWHSLASTSPWRYRISMRSSTFYLVVLLVFINKALCSVGDSIWGQGPVLVTIISVAPFFLGLKGEALRPGFLPRLGAALSGLYPYERSVQRCGQDLERFVHENIPFSVRGIPL